MKFFIALVIFFSSRLLVNAQQPHFLYIQTENSQPFYVKLNDTVYSSSAAGYLIIPKLMAEKLSLGIGFPNNEWPQQNIDVTVPNDAGYLLKNFDAKGWGLFNMQTMNVLMAMQTSAIKNPVVENKTDAFSKILAGVVNSPGIMQNNPVTENGNSVDNEKQPQQHTAIKSLQENVTTPLLKIFSALDNTGRSMIYLNANENSTDTIRVFIPYDKISTSADATASTQEAIINNYGVESLSKGAKDSSMKSFPANDEKEAVDNKAVISNVIITSKDDHMIALNPDCKALATNEDFLKLRKKMAAENTDEDMIAVARRVFRTKCFSTAQVKNLSLLFLKDAGKYGFYDAAYSYVSDQQDFKTLGAQLTEVYYITRFKAMIRQ